MRCGAVRCEETLRDAGERIQSSGRLNVDIGWTGQSRSVTWADMNLVFRNTISAVGIDVGTGRLPRYEK